MCNLSLQTNCVVGGVTICGKASTVSGVSMSRGVALCHYQLVLETKRFFLNRAWLLLIEVAGSPKCCFLFKALCGTACMLTDLPYSLFAHTEWPV